jgi:putative membrane protein
MVSTLSLQEHALIDDAIKQAEQKISVRISVVVRPASASYHTYALGYGLALGSMAALVLWWASVLHSFPLLLSVQLGIVALCDFVHQLTGYFTRLCPRRLRFHHAEQEAMRAYHILDARLPHDAPFVLLFVSQAERYVHIVTSPAVHRLIPGGWDRIADNFTQSIRQKPIAAACAEAVAAISEHLAARF